MELQRPWGDFVLTARNISCPPKCGFQIGSSLEQDRNVIPLELWTSWRGKLEEKSNPQIRRSCQETTTGVAETQRGQGHRGCAYTIWPIRKDLVVISRWAHCPWNLESPEAASACPVSMTTWPAKQEEPGGSTPVLCRRLLSYVGPRETGQVQQENMGDLTTSGMVDSILHMLA
jgi:hypothetical protein